jgi:UDP-N-acetylglucosamine 2-epimerase (non-hydrolysing)
MSISIVHVAGARPNFLKIGPVLEACRAEEGLSSRLVHTGQHYDERMSRLFFDELGLPRPDRNLEVGSGGHAAQTAAVMERFEPLLLEWRPDLVLVVGDVNSTLACALVAAKLGVPVAHVEAGLRSFDRSMPEEINRKLTDAVSDLLFVSEPAGLENLAREGADPAAVHFVGNVMIDSLVRHRARADTSDVLARLGLEAAGYAVVTLHRPANVDAPGPLARILEPILELAARMPVVLPAHPRARGAIERALARGAPPAFRVVEPLGYLDFLKLTAEARLVLTDSGGVQEETTILRVPCVTLRDNTERPVTVTAGTNRLGGTSAGSIRRAIGQALDLGIPPGLAAPPLWDGAAAERIAAILAAWGAERVRS